MSSWTTAEWAEYVHVTLSDDFNNLDDIKRENWILIVKNINNEARNTTKKQDKRFL